MGDRTGSNAESVVLVSAGLEPANPGARISLQHPEPSRCRMWSKATRLEFVINLKTAAALGLIIPERLVEIANELIG
jgi:hypothetical protein